MKANSYVSDQHALGSADSKTILFAYAFANASMMPRSRIRSPSSQKMSCFAKLVGYLMSVYLNAS